MKIIVPDLYCIESEYQYGNWEVWKCYFHIADSVLFRWEQLMLSIHEMFCSSFVHSQVRSDVPSTSSSSSKI